MFAAIRILDNCAGAFESLRGKMDLGMDGDDSESVNVETDIIMRYE